MNFYLEALQDEHLLLERVLDNYCEQSMRVGAQIRHLLSTGKADRILFCGMGSSLYAAKSIMALINTRGIRAVECNAYELLHYSLGSIDEKTIVVAISQSGNTPEILLLMEKCRNRAAMTIAMVNSEDCSLWNMADARMELLIGRETSISNKSFYAQVAQLNVLASVLIGEKMADTVAEIREAIRWHGKYVLEQRQITSRMIDFLRGTTLCDLLGDDAQMGAALQAGLVLREAAKIPACSHSLSDYNHGWFEIAKPGYSMVIFADAISESDQMMINHCKQNKGKVLLLTSAAVREDANVLRVALPQVKKSILPLYSIVPAYFFAGMYLE